MEQLKDAFNKDQNLLVVDLNEYIRNNDRDSVKDEPILEAISINKKWGLTWPRVVARFWRGDEAKDKGEYNDDRLFRDNLVSGNPDKVRECLIEEGFSPSPIHYGAPKNIDMNWYWKNMCIIVRERHNDIYIDTLNEYLNNNNDDKYSKDSKKIISKEIIDYIENQFHICLFDYMKDYYENKKKCTVNPIGLLKHFIKEVEYQSNYENFKASIKSYDTIKETICINLKTLDTKLIGILADPKDLESLNDEEKNNKIDGVIKKTTTIAEEIIKNIFSDMKSMCNSIGKKEYYYILDNVNFKIENIRKKYLENKYSNVNGWSNVKGLQHFIILTLPPKPDESEGASAIAEYNSSGKVYPFTCPM